MTGHGIAFKAAVIGLLIAAGGCSRDAPNPVREARQDARDVAMVERMNQVPFKAIVLQPISEPQRLRHDLDTGGCRFYRVGEEDPIFVAGPDEAVLQVEGAIKKLAAKSASAQLASGVHATYVGLAIWVDLTSQSGAGREAVESRTGDGPGAELPMQLYVHDAQDRVAFTAHGVLSCAAAAEADNSG